MLLGVILSAILYGVSLLQCLFYFTRASPIAPAASHAHSGMQDMTEILCISKPWYALLPLPGVITESKPGSSHPSPRHHTLGLRHPYRYARCHNTIQAQLIIIQCIIT